VIVDCLCFICPCISLFKLYFYTNLIGCICFYEANTIVQIVRKYSSPKSKFWIPKFSSIVKPVVISDIDFQNPKFKISKLPDPKFSDNANTHSCCRALAQPYLQVAVAPSALHFLPRASTRPVSHRTYACLPLRVLYMHSRNKRTHEPRPMRNMQSACNHEMTTAKVSRACACSLRLSFLTFV
jgi:hypothetical protein